MAKNIYQKLSEIQKRLIIPKEQFNKFGNFNFRSCEDIIKALKPILDEYNCVVYLTNKLLMMGERFYVEAEAKLIDLESDEIISVTAHAREENEKKGMDGSQITGSASSYARKYALSGLFMIDNEKDSDETYEFITPKQKEEIYHELNRTGIKETEVFQRYGISKIDDLPAAKFEKLISQLQAVPDIHKE